jgi:Zinc carboxypeptidase
MFRKAFLLSAVLVLAAGVLPGAANAADAAEAQLPATATGLIAPLSRGEVLDLPAVDSRVPRPDAFLGYPLGSRFTSWDRMLEYVAAVAAASPRVKVEEYGRTSEGRPLRLVTIATPENLARLDEIRRDHLRLAEPAGVPEGERDRLVQKLPAIVWLAYGVHGNESSSAEAALATLYLLAAGQGEIEEILRNTVVLIDPLVNPDGRERYVSSFRQRTGEAPNPNRAAAEHWEPWPGGRPNHYLIDLNRDWAWVSQQETRQRIALYRTWEPHVYVDFHEMSSDSSYFFPPAADPVHPRIDRRVVSWLDTFGRGNAEAFDRLGWVYFKGENYDLFYPGYGDSYPSLRGAVGMTYEMAGGGRGGLAISLPDGSVLTLADRVARHLTTSLATLRTASRNTRKLREDFVATRLHAGSGGRVYLWSAEQQEARALADLLALHGVRVHQLSQAEDVPARRLVGGEEAPRRFAAGTYVVSTVQPLGNLVDALLELDSPMNDPFIERQRQRLEANLEPEFYDITAWSLPLAYNVDTWVASRQPGGLRPLGEAAGGIRGDGRLGFLVPPQGLGSYRLAAELRKRKMTCRIALSDFTGPAGSYPAGTLFIPRLGNPENLRDLLQGVLAENKLTAEGVTASWEIEGISLGSNNMPVVRPVRIGLISGEGVDSTSFGFLWSLLDRQIGVPHDRVDVSTLRQIELADFDVLVLPGGSYEDRIGERARTALDTWIKDGGELVAVGDAIQWLQEHELSEVKRWEPPKPEEEAKGDGAAEDPEVAGSLVERELASRPIFTPGAVLATQMQPLHPLTAGLATSPPVLYEGTTVLKTFGDPRKDVLVALDENPVLAGFAWPEAEERLAGSLLVGMEPRGSGAIVLFAQDPAFRLFWRATAPIFLNAVLYGPSAGIGGRN